MPVPVSMWRPRLTSTRQSSGAQAHLFANPVATAGDVRIAPLICYDQLLVWPVLHPTLHRPDVIIAIGNGWWTGDSNIIKIKRTNAEAWARLLDVPFVIAFNH